MNVFPIKGAIQDYQWGGTRFIPELTSTSNPSNTPYAELWMGAHHRGSARLNEETSLADFIAQAPEEVLGKTVAKTFDNTLPFLFKVLDVSKMLSIQSHPTKEQAEIGFANENAKGVPLNASYRNFKDNNHKPEVMVALTDFWLLHGFKSEAAITETLQGVPELRPLQKYFAEQDIYALYEAIMRMPQIAINTLLAPLNQRLSKAETLSKDSPDYWARLAFQDYTRAGNFDRGICSIYLFNLLKMQRGEGIYQAAGVPHAYLEGVNIELMGNSDNVFRGGLTPKHIDVDELLQHIISDAVTPKILHGKQYTPQERIYITPAPDFELSRIDLQTEEKYTITTNAPDTLIVLAGTVTVINEDTTFNCQRGDSFFACAGSTYTIKAAQTAELYRASVPIMVIEEEV